MQKAVKRETASLASDLSGEILIPENDTGNGTTNQKLAKIRKKISSVQLENLLAEQLENELSLEQSQFTTSRPDNSTVPDHSETSTMLPRAFESQTHAHEKLLEICTQLAEKLATNTKYLIEVSASSTELVDCLQHIKHEIIEPDSAKHSKADDPIQDCADDELEQQMFSAMLDQNNHSVLQSAALDETNLTENITFLEVKELREELDAKNLELEAVHAALSQSQRACEEIKTGYVKLSNELKQSQEAVNALEAEFAASKQAQATAEAEQQALVEENNRNLQLLAKIENKYNQLNIRGLNQQNAHFAKIQQLEDQLREIKRQTATNIISKADF